jgi:Na+-translocating ferredoxin:NAD+ oxidoreductase RnfG subunit
MKKQILSVAIVLALFSIGATAAQPGIFMKLLQAIEAHRTGAIVKQAQYIVEDGVYDESKWDDQATYQ